MNKSQIPKNTFFDINKFPAHWGKLFFPISLLKMGTSQSPETIINIINYFTVGYKFQGSVGADIVFSDLLYLYNSDKDALEWKDYSCKCVSDYVSKVKREIKKNIQTIQVPQAFEFQGWIKLYMSYNGDFYRDFQQLKKIAQEDPKFMEYLESDSKSFGRELTENQMNFFLEEHLLFTSYMMLHSKLYNQFTQDRERWFLFCYPGKPPKAHIYLWQLNPFHFKSKDKNPYIGFYNYEEKKFYDFNNIDLETYTL